MFNVLRIGNNAFWRNPIKTLNIPESVKYLSGFQETDLTEITIPGTVEEIGSYAFRRTNISEVTIENGVQKIGSRAFETTKINRIIIPESVTVVDSHAFTDTDVTPKNARFDNFRYNVRLHNDAFSFKSPVFIKSEYERLAIEKVELVEWQTDSVIAEGVISDESDEDEIIIHLPKKYTEEQIEK